MGENPSRLPQLRWLLRIVLGESVLRAVTERLEAFRRIRAVGTAPDLIAFAILQVKLSPSLERAADFATDAVPGRLSQSLSNKRAATVSGNAAFEAFGTEWRDVDPSLRRAVTLLSIAMDAPADRRAETLEDALEAVLDGANERVVEFSTAIRGPAMGIYAFGVMLPLALVGLLPVLASNGGGLSTLALAIIYDLLIPFGLAGSALWLWGRRPAVTDRAFDAGLLAHATDRSRVLAAGALGAGMAVTGATALTPDWVRPIVGGGVGCGIALAYFLHPVVEEQGRLADLEVGLPDVLVVLGQRLEEGAPLETIIEAVGARFDGPIGDLFERGAVRRDRSGDPVESVFLGEGGVLADVPNRRVRAALSLTTTAGEYGPAGGRTLQAVGGYLAELFAVERESRRELAQTTSTLTQTALVFAPAIAGVTVALATGMQSVEGTGQALDVAALGRIIGIYVLLLAAILPSLSVVLERGFDPFRMGFQSGVALAVASVVYPLSFVTARSLVYV
ncbi:MAG: type II secretion system protein [Halodesulfurarchaeum sp.]